VTARSRVVRAPGVELDGGDVVDRVRGLRLPANATARAVLAAADGRTIAELVPELGAHGAIAFCTQLNRHLLVNVRGLAALRLPVRTTPLRAIVPASLALAVVALPAALLLHAWALAPALGGGVLLHELAHTAALGLAPRAGVRRGLRPSLLHARLGPGRALAVGVAGPLAPALAAFAFVHVAAVAAVVLASHALALTVASPDGRNACGLS